MNPGAVAFALNMAKNDAGREAPPPSVPQVPKA